MTRTQALKPCPFCGVPSDNRMEPIDPNRTVIGHRVTCGSCGAQTDLFSTAEKAIAAWNRRPDSKEPKP